MAYTETLKLHYKIIFHHVGTLFTYFPVIVLVPILFCFAYPEEWSNALFFAETALVSLSLGLLLRYLFKPPKNAPLTIKEGTIIVLFTWTIGIFISALPFVFSGTLNMSQAIFESTSGWTTTGLTVVDVTTVSKLILVWRSLMQFLGGAGFAIIMLSAVIGPSGFGLYYAEGRIDNIMPNIRASVRMILVIYLSYAAGGIIAYLLAGMNFFDAFNHSLTALASGGFSTRAGSIGEFNSLAVEIVTVVLMVMGTTGFGVHYTLWSGKFKQFLKNGEPWTLLSILLLFTPVLIRFTTFSLYPEAPARTGIFQAVSALTTTGFSTVSFERWNDLGLYVLTLLMIFGGGMDSTSGGLKLFRLYALARAIWAQLISFFRPRTAVETIVLYKGQKAIELDLRLLKEILIIFTFYFIFYCLGVGVLAAYGYSLADSAFEYASALSTVGLSVGITRPDMPAPILWVETVGMFMGRLEFLVVFYAIIKLVRDVKILKEVSS
ncbi:MAG: trk/ktr system potassium uptake protein [Thermotogota bacterium]|nr:trk/ktr system potassium uptake protein [Thermotogota bacterium]